MTGNESVIARRGSRRIPPRGYLAAVIAAGGIVLVASIVELVRQPVGGTWFVLVGLTIVTGAATLRKHDVPVWFSTSDTFTIAAALLFGPPAGAITVALDALVMSIPVVRTRAPGVRIRVLFNATSTALAMWMAAHMFFAITRQGPLAEDPGSIQRVVGPLLLFAAAYFVLNTGLIATAVANDRGASIAAVWRQHFSFLWLTYFGGASIAAVLVLMTVARVVDVTAIVLILPLLVILHVAYRAAIDRIQERIEHFTKLAAYAAALRSTADAALTTDREGRITLINPAAEALTGWNERDALGRAEREVFCALHPESRVRDDAVGPAGEPVVREHILVRRDGSERPIEEMHARIYDQSGQVIGTIRTFRDITQRKAIDAERDALLRREQQARSVADEANRLKDEFLTNLSHELRTPATGILGWVRLLKSGRLDETNTRQALDALERSARAQARLLDDLLDMSRIVRGTLRLESGAVDLRDALAGAAETIEPAMRLKGVNLHTELPDGLAAVHADPDRLRQVFWNLLTNAVKFSAQGGTIRVRVVPHPDHVQIDVTDDGTGIDPAQLPFIFDRFRQADGSTTRAHGGLGLGLAIVRHLVELHGGTVTASSPGLGQGSTFTVRLPSAQYPAAARVY